MHIAELFLNYLEHITVMEDAFGKDNKHSLDRFCTQAVEASPILRQRLSEGPESFSDSLSSGRLESESSIARPDGATGAGRAVPLTEDTGYFWFFNAANVEVIVKVLDGCPVRAPIARRSRRAR